MNASEFLHFRLRHGWSRADLAEVLHASRTSVRDWSTGRRQVPPDVAAWCAQYPPVPYSRAWPATRGGLRLWFARHAITCNEFAQFCGVSERTVQRWLREPRPLPLAIRAWLQAGAPPDWEWRPPPLEGRRDGLMRRSPQVQHRIAACYRRKHSA